MVAILAARCRAVKRGRSLRPPEPFLATAAIEAWGQFSPDGKRGRVSIEPIGTFEVYVRSFHGAGGQWLVSTDGLIHPRWSSKGTELLYLAPISSRKGLQLAGARTVTVTGSLVVMARSVAETTN